MPDEAARRCLEFALSSDGGTSFSAVGKETVNNQLAGPSSAVSALAVIDNHNDVAHNYFKTNWKACAESTGGWAAEISETSGSSFVVVSPTVTTAKNVDGGRTSWPNITIAASLQSKIYLEGSSEPKCHGNPDYGETSAVLHKDHESDKEVEEEDGIDGKRALVVRQTLADEADRRARRPRECDEDEDGVNNARMKHHIEEAEENGCDAERGKAVAQHTH